MDMPEIVEVQPGTNGSVLFTLAVSAALDVFNGHFDGAPVVPGIVQVNWALQLANRYLVELSPFAIGYLEAIKFQHVMLPDSTLQLELALKANKLHFDFHDAQQRYSSGRVVFDQ